MHVAYNYHHLLPVFSRLEKNAKRYCCDQNFIFSLSSWSLHAFHDKHRIGCLLSQIPLFWPSPTLFGFLDTTGSICFFLLLRYGFHFLPFRLPKNTSRAFNPLVECANGSRLALVEGNEFSPCTFANQKLVLYL